MTDLEGFTVKEVAQRLRCSTDRIYDLLDSGKLRKFYLGEARGKGSDIRIPPSSLAEFIQGASRAEPAPVPKEPARRVVRSKTRLFLRPAL